MIDNYTFGKIIISGKTYSSDVIIFPDRVSDSWWRKEGHSLHPDDLNDVVELKPEVVVLGTGCYGVMKVPKKTEEYLKSQGIELIALPTQKACDKFNEIKGTKNVIGCFHLTC